MPEVAPSRRTIVRGAAWSVPVVAAAATAPAYAASCGSTTYNYVLDWGTAALARSTNGNANIISTLASSTAGSSGIGVTVTSTSTGSVTRSGAYNLQVTTNANAGAGWNNVGGSGGPALMIYNTNMTAGEANRQEVAISFDRDVTGLGFTITDIDRDASRSWSWGGWSDWDGFWDRVTLTGPTSYTAQKAAGVLGSGGANDPWYFQERSSGNYTSNRLIDSSAANVTVSFGGTIPAYTPITLRYWSAYSGSQQAIYLTDLTWAAAGC